MPVYERAFTYQVAKSTLKSLLINIRLIIKAMAMQLNCNTTADGLTYDWKSVLDEGWYNPELLQILSFHNSAGNEIATSILLPMVNGILTNCHKPDVCFVHVQITLEHAALFFRRPYWPNIYQINVLHQFADHNYPHDKRCRRSLQSNHPSRTRQPPHHDCRQGSHPDCQPLPSAGPHHTQECRLQPRRSQCRHNQAS